jgi:hypothetical protein
MIGQSDNGRNHLYSSAVDKENVSEEQPKRMWMFVLFLVHRG